MSGVPCWNIVDCLNSGSQKITDVTTEEKSEQSQNTLVCLEKKND
jgi:hypothetical protein